MSRVLLMVQTGDERPKCAGIVGPLGAVPWQRRPAALATALGEYGVTSEQQHEVESADRWWLVEASCADDARMTIACPAGEWGRILASGGRGARYGGPR